MKKIILINGKKRSGKDYTASVMVNRLKRLGITSETMSFADPMKEILTTTLGLSLADFNHLKNERAMLYAEDKTVRVQLLNFRQLIQNFGEEAMKPIFGPNVWADILHKKANKSQADVILIPDFRFPCEHIPGSVTIQVVNNDLTEDDSHISENSIGSFEFQYVIDNTGQPDITEDIDFILNEIL